jgi:hypothetical protein
MNMDVTSVSKKEQILSKTGAAVFVISTEDIRRSSWAYRAFARYSNLEDSLFPGGSNAADAWHSGRLGLRSDWRPSSRDSVSIQGDPLLFEGGQTTLAVLTTLLTARDVNEPGTNTSGDALGRWTHTLANGSELSVRLYDCAMSRRNVAIEVANNTLDLKIEHHIAACSRHDIVRGVDHRLLPRQFVDANELRGAESARVADRQSLCPVSPYEILINKSLFLIVGFRFVLEVLCST